MDCLSLVNPCNNAGIPTLWSGNGTAMALTRVQVGLQVKGWVTEPTSNQQKLLRLVMICGKQQIVATFALSSRCYCYHQGEALFPTELHVNPSPNCLLQPAATSYPTCYEGKSGLPAGGCQSQGLIATWHTYGTTIVHYGMLKSKLRYHKHAIQNLTVTHEDSNRYTWKNVSFAINIATSMLPQYPLKSMGGGPLKHYFTSILPLYTIEMIEVSKNYIRMV